MFEETKERKLQDCWNENLQDRQLAKNIYFLANNFGESRHFSHAERIRVVTCRQLGRSSRQLLL
jgi:hypothetical protein